MKLSRKKSILKYTPIFIVVILISAIAGFISPEFENIKARFSLVSSDSEIKVTENSIWSHISFPEGKAYVTVTKLNSPSEIKEIRSSDCGVITRDIFGNLRLINPIGIILHESEPGNDVNYVIGSTGKILYRHNNKAYDVVFGNGKTRSVRTAGVVNTATLIRGEGETFAIGTNAKRLWLVGITKNGFKYRKKRLPGAPIYARVMNRRLVMLCTENTCIYEWDPETDRSHIINLPEGFFDSLELSAVSNIGFLCEGSGKTFIMDRNGQICFSKDTDSNYMNEYITSPLGRYIGIVGVNTLESHGKQLTDGYAASFDLTTGKKVWETEYLINSNRLIGLLDDGDAVFYDPSDHSIFRKTPNSPSMELLTKLPSSIQTLLRDGNCLYILCQGELWIIRQINEIE